MTGSTRPSRNAPSSRRPERVRILGGYWSAYWYDGYIYGTEIARGLDVLKLLPSEHLTGNEIEAASLASRGGFNAQQQRRIDWPASPVVARTYLDQLSRSRAIRPERARTLTSALDRAEAVSSEKRKDEDVSRRLDTIAGELESDRAAASGRDQARLQSLAETVKGIARSLR